MSPGMLPSKIDIRIIPLRIEFEEINNGCLAKVYYEDYDDNMGSFKTLNEKFYGENYKEALEAVIESKMFCL